MSDIQPYLAASFIHPGMALVGAMCAAIPIIIHFLNRRRFKRIRWAAMEFLLAARKKTMRRMQFEQILLLLLRCAVMALIGAAVARPLLTGGAAGMGSVRRARAIVLDNSYSMQQRDSDQFTPLQRGKRWLQQFADQFDTTDSVAFVLAGAATHSVIDRPVIDHELFKQRVEEVGAAAVGTDLAASIDLAAAALEQSDVPAAGREIYLLGDRTAADWSDPALAASLKQLHEQTAVIFVDLAPKDDANLAITRLNCNTGPVPVGRTVRVEAEVTNFGSLPANTRNTVWKVNGQRWRQDPLPLLPSGASHRWTAELRFNSEGDHRVSLELEADALPIDDTRYLIVQARQQLPVLLVDGSPSNEMLKSATGYLRQALAPGAAEPTDLFEPVIIAELALPSTPLDSFAVVVLADVSRVAEGTVQRLQEYVRAGGGLIMFMGPRVDLGHFNRVFASDTGITSVVLEQIIAPEQGKDTFTEPLISHPVLADFIDALGIGQGPGAGLLWTKIQRYVRLKVTDEHKVILKIGDDPAWVESQIGDGRVLICATTADSRWNGLPAKPEFVPLIHGAVGYVARRSSMQRQLLVGDPALFESSSPYVSGQVQLLDEHGIKWPATILDQGAFQAATAPLPNPGFYRWNLDESDDAGWGIAVNVDPSEGRLKRIELAKIESLLAGRPTAILDGRTDPPPGAASVATPPRELAKTAVWLLLAAAMMEMLLAQRWGSGR